MKIAIINSTKKQYATKDFGEGHDFAVVNTTQLNIKYCTGCFGCWHKTPGLCVQKDDMPQVLRAMINADLVVFVADVLTGFVSAEMKKINDKSIPLLSPFMSIIKGEVHHAKRYEKYPDYGLVLIEKEEISAGLPCAAGDPAELGSMRKALVEVGKPGVEVGTERVDQEQDMGVVRPR